VRSLESLLYTFMVRIAGGKRGGVGYYLNVVLGWKDVFFYNAIALPNFTAFERMGASIRLIVNLIISCQS
jgi:hypothetical protein